MLPSPTISFTIPSIHDELVLDCRIYHPTCLAPTSISHLREWGKKAAIVAHPYAPLGGCYDDPVVNLVASTILKEGFVVGTFNFRGVTSGRTSWSSKGEQDDYISFIGFMIYYIHHLSLPHMPFEAARFAQSDPDIHDLTTIPSQAIPSAQLSKFNFENYPAGQMTNQPRLLLAGYSYGSLITTLLPPIISSIVVPFQTPLPGSAYAEIRMRAERLATQQNQQIEAHMLAFHQSHIHRGRPLHSDDIHNPKGRKSSGGVRMGGEEDLRRSSHESYRSRRSFSIDAPELVRKSVDRVRSIGKTKRGSPRRTNTQSSNATFGSKDAGSNSSQENITPFEDIIKPDEVVPLKAIPGVGQGLKPAYLLVSPLQGMVGSLATMWSSKGWKSHASASEHEMKLSIDPTLALFGDDDVFVSVKKLRTWAQKLVDAGNVSGTSQFRYAEVESAGHFWHNHEAMKILMGEIATFTREL